MRPLLFSATVIAAIACGGFVPALAAPLLLSGFRSQHLDASPIEEVGWRRQLRRYGYPVPYYPPAYGYYAPPPAYAYYPPAYGPYPPPPAPPVGAYATGEAAYGDYPPTNGDYGDYPPADGY